MSSAPLPSPPAARTYASLSQLSAPCLLPHYSKCLFELALLSLGEQGLITQHGLGGASTALYSVAEEARGRAEDMAYRDFPVSGAGLFC